MAQTYSVFTCGAGHSAKSPGASGCGCKEHEEARLITAQLIKTLKARGCAVVDTTSDASNQNAVLAEQVAKCNAVNAGSKQLNLVIHLNSGGGTGTEVLCYDENGKQLAAKISASIAKTLGVKDRSAKLRPDLYVIRKTLATTLLLEVCFIDNSSDMSKLVSKRKAVAEAIADVLVGKPKSSTTSSTQLTLSTSTTGVDIYGLVDWLKAKGIDSSFANRAKLAVEYGIVKNKADYAGTYAQNVALLAALKGASK